MRSEKIERKSSQIIMVGRDESELKRIVQEGVDAGNIVSAVFTGNKVDGFTAMVTLTTPVKYMMQSMEMERK